METNKIKETINENWEKIKENLRNEYNISDISYSTWIKPLKYHNYKNDTVFITIPNDMAQASNYISNKYKSYFVVTITEMTGYQVDVSFVLEKDISNISNNNNVVYNIKSENANLNSKYRFETFVVGNNNKFAHSAALAVAESPGTEYNPLFLYGGSGLGKTHLMHAIGHYILDNNKNSKVLYVPSENFTEEIVQAIRSGNSTRLNEIREKYRSVDVLLIDDIQYIIGKEATQQEFFNTFNDLHSAGKQIIISSDKKPKELDTLEERFRTRFEWGLIADIQAPDYETRMAILKKNAENYGKIIDDEVFEYIASNITSNIRELEGAFNKLIAFSRLHKVDISTDILEDALKDYINPNKINEINSDTIIKTVADYFNINKEDITSKRRTNDLVLPRQICMYLCKQLTQDSLQQIAKSMQKKDHTTVMHGVNKIAEDIKVDKSLYNKIEAIKKILNPG
ncbi:MAG: chromosomal replication initiator protein DnaA [Lachnospiraceae bacterium]|nr:chromosomal replication initiator protein DnaA [Lachnospiraceae bacterium]